MKKTNEQIPALLLFLISAIVSSTGLAQTALQKSPDSTAVQAKAIPAADLEILTSIESNLVFVEGDTFLMGCTRGQGAECMVTEKPVHRVRLDGFHMMKYEVTQEQWKIVMGNNPSVFQGCNQCPVENASFIEIQDFISKLNKLTGKLYRLPTEAQWEYAARGGTKGHESMYAGSDSILDVAWIKDNSDKQTHPVGQKKPNALGLFDMSGNVWEWCTDWYNAYKKGLQSNPKGPATGGSHVARGGSFLGTATQCRVAYRAYAAPGDHSMAMGFRLILQQK